MANKEIRRKLFDAIVDDDLEAVKVIVNRYGLSYCRAWSGGYTLLCNATKFERDEIAKFLVQKGAKVNSQNCTVETPLHYAARKGSTELVEMLINRCASLDAQSPNKDTPLRIATANNRIDTVKLLLNRGADCWTDSRPLLRACCDGFTEIAKLLLNFRARKQPLSLQPLHLALALASKAGAEDIVSSLLNAGADPNAVIESDIVGHWYFSLGTKKNSSPVPLLLACQQGHVAVIKLLLEHGAQLNCSRQEDGYQPLHIASKYGHVEIVNHLLDIGVDPNIEADEKVTPLHLAVESYGGYSEVAELLLNKGANVNAQTNKGSTPLIRLAASKGNVKCAEILLKRGACVNLKDNDQNSALNFAVKSGDSGLISQILKYNPDIDDDKVSKSIISKILSYQYTRKYVDDLIEYGWTLNREDASNPMLLRAAVGQGYMKIVECILNHGLDGDSEIHDPTLLHVAVENGHEGIVKLLLKAGYDISAKDTKGNMPICYSMDCKEKGKWADIFVSLLAAGAVIEDATKFLHQAVDKECFDMCKSLIENCTVDVNAQNKFGKTPLLVITSKTICYDTLEEQLNAKGKIDEAVSAEIVKLLLSSGADVHSETRDGFTALHLAADRGKKEAVQILLHFGADVNSRAKGRYVGSDNFSYFHSKPLEIKNGPTALHLAACGGHAEVIKVLLEFDADVETRHGNENQTALYDAINRNHDEVVKVLLENRCDISVENNEGKTVLDFAYEKAKETRKLEYISYDDEYYSSGEDDPNYVYVRIDPEDHEASNTLKKHMIKLRVAGFYVPEKILQQINYKPLLIDFQRECEEELNKMKAEKLDSHLTLNDILMDSKNKALVKNESLMQTLESLDFNKYPIYGSFIVNSVKKNKRKMKLLIAGQESLNILVKTSSALDEKESPILLDEVSEEILSYLSDKELRNLAASGEGIKNQLCK